MKKLLFAAFLMLFSPQLLMASTSQPGESEDGSMTFNTLGDII